MKEAELDTRRKALKINLDQRLKIRVPDPVIVGVAWRKGTISAVAERFVTALKCSA